MSAASRRVVVIGGRADGHGRVVLEIAAACPGVEVLGFLDDAPTAKVVAGAPWLGPASRWRELKDGAEFHVAIGHNPIRRRIAREIEDGGGALATLVHPRAVVSPSAVVGAGTLVAPGAVLAPGASVGRNSIVNHGVLVEHDGRVADHVNLSTAFACGGRTQIEEGVFAGVGVTVIPDTRLARWCYFGAGTVVIAHTEPHGLYVGNPARRVRTLGTDDAPASA